MKIHVLVEGPSEADWIAPWAKRFVPRHYVQVHPHEGKGRLLEGPPGRQTGVLDQLPGKLRAFGSDAYDRSDRVLVLVDRDGDRCPELGNRMRAQLAKVTPAPVAKFRVAVVETEAFFLGDRDAIRSAWPEADLRHLQGTTPDVDWTAALFMRVIGSSLPNKRGWARQIAPHLGTKLVGAGANRSPSFRAFAGALLELCDEKPPPPRPVRGRPPRR
jgi:hypothetical protein